MADPPPRRHPPPLPIRPPGTEPFPRARSTPPSGGVPAHEAEHESVEPTRAELQRQLEQAKALIAALQQSQGSTDHTPVPETRPSERVRRARRAATVALLTGEWSFVLLLVPALARLITWRWPEYGEFLDEALRVVGLVQ